MIIFQAYLCRCFGGTRVPEAWVARVGDTGVAFEVVAARVVRGEGPKDAGWDVQQVADMLDAIRTVGDHACAREVKVPSNMGGEGAASAKLREFSGLTASEFRPCLALLASALPCFGSG